MRNLSTKLLLAACLFSISSQGITEDKKIASESFSNDTIAFNYKGNFSKATISIAGPNGFSIKSFKENGDPIVNLSNARQNNSSNDELSSSSNETLALTDGLYKYEISAATGETLEISDTLNNGRGESAKTTMNVSETQSGHFRVENGSIVNYLDIKEGE